MVENIKAGVVITDESKIEIALSKIRFGVMGAGGCNAVGGSIIGGMHKQSIDRSDLLKANSVVRDADPVILAKVKKKLKRKESPTSADFAGTI